MSLSFCFIKLGLFRLFIIFELHRNLSTNIVILHLLQRTFWLKDYFMWRAVSQDSYRCWYCLILLETFESMFKIYPSSCVSNNRSHVNCFKLILHLHHSLFRIYYKYVRGTVLIQFRTVLNGMLCHTIS